MNFWEPARREYTRRLSTPMLIATHRIFNENFWTKPSLYLSLNDWRSAIFFLIRETWTMRDSPSTSQNPRPHIYVPILIRVGWWANVVRARIQHTLTKKLTIWLRSMRHIQWIFSEISTGYSSVCNWLRNCTCDRGNLTDAFESETFASMYIHRLEKQAQEWKDFVREILPPPTSSYNTESGKKHSAACVSSRFSAHTPALRYRRRRRH